MNNFRRRLRRLATGLAITGALAGVTAGSAAAAYDPSDPAQKAQYDQALTLGTQGYVFGVPLLDTREDVPEPHEHRTSATDRRSAARSTSSARTGSWWTRRSAASSRRTTTRSTRTHGSTSRRIRSSCACPRRTAGSTSSRSSTPTQENFGNDRQRRLRPARAGRLRDHRPEGPRQAHPRRHDRDQVAVQPRVGPPAHSTSTTPTRPTRAPCTRSRTRRSSSRSRTGRRYGFDYTPAPPKTPDTTPSTPTIPGTQPGDDPLAFFDALNVSMGQFRPTAADQPLIDQLKTVGHRAGRQGRDQEQEAQRRDARRAQRLGRRRQGEGQRRRSSSCSRRGSPPRTATSFRMWTTTARTTTSAPSSTRSASERCRRTSRVYPIALTDRTAAPLSSQQALRAALQRARQLAAAAAADSGGRVLVGHDVRR